MATIVNMEEFVKGQHGTFTITGTDPVEVNAHAIHIDANTIFANIEINKQ